MVARNQRSGSKSSVSYKGNGKEGEWFLEEGQAKNEVLVRRKVWQGMRSGLVKRKERMSYSTLFSWPYIASAGWAPNNHPITSRKPFTCWVQLNILLGDWIM